MLLQLRYLLCLLALTLGGNIPLARSNYNGVNPVLRKQLVAAITSSKKTDSLYSVLTAVKPRTAIVTGYIATLQALKAKHNWNPYYKIKYLSDAEKTFKQAVSAEPHNIEIRFMRFSVEHNVPGFLGYNKNLNADKTELLSQLSHPHNHGDDELVKTIIDFMIQSKRCTPAERQSLNDYLAAL
jgi:hypothetical protein